MALDVLAAQASVLWWVQGRETPLQIAGVAVFDAGPMRDEAGTLRLDDLRARVAAVLVDTPRFRQWVRQLPLAQGVAWEDDEHFDVAHHVTAGVVPSPGGDAELRGEVARILELPLDPDRPLWEMRLLDGLAHDRGALVLKASHVLLDGMALLDFALRILDPTPVPPPLPPAPRWHPSRPSGAVERLATGMTARIGQVAAGLQQAGALFVDPRAVAGAAGAAGAVVDVARMVAGGAASAAPPVPLTGRVGTTREVVWTRVPIDEVRRVARAESVTVNDVVLAMAAGALADYRDAHTVPTRRDPRVVVPLSVHGAPGDEVDNRWSVIVADLPLDPPDPLERLRHIHAELLPRRTAAPSSVGARVFALAGLVPPWFLRIVGRFALEHQPVADVAVTNLRGPPTPVYLLGGRVLEVYPLVSGTGNIATIVGVLSYDDGLGICITVDREVVPDPEVLLAGFVRGLRALLDASDARGRGPRPGRGSVADG
jgi:diacylglycerol O-acyltransferase